MSQEKHASTCLLLSHNGHRDPESGERSLIHTIGDLLMGHMGVARYVRGAQFGTLLAASEVEQPVLNARIVMVELSDASLSPRSQQAEIEAAALETAARAGIPCVLVARGAVYIEHAAFLRHPAIVVGIALVILGKNADESDAAHLRTRLFDARVILHRKDTETEIARRIQQLAEYEPLRPPYAAE